jgi:hypothetical protein
MELMKSGQTLKTVVPSVAQDDKLSSHQCTMLPASEISWGLSDEPYLAVSQRLGSKWMLPQVLATLINKHSNQAVLCM